MPRAALRACAPLLALAPRCCRFQRHSTPFPCLSQPRSTQVAAHLPPHLPRRRQRVTATAAAAKTAAQGDAAAAALVGTEPSMLMQALATRPVSARAKGEGGAAAAAAPRWRTWRRRRRRPVVVAFGTARVGGRQQHPRLRRLFGEAEAEAGGGKDGGTDSGRGDGKGGGKATMSDEERQRQRQQRLHERFPAKRYKLALDPFQQRAPRRTSLRQHRAHDIHVHVWHMTCMYMCE